MTPNVSGIVSEGIERYSKVQEDCGRFWNVWKVPKYSIGVLDQPSHLDLGITQPHLTRRLEKGGGHPISRASHRAGKQGRP
jgi:hypothetical protein